MEPGCLEWNWTEMDREACLRAIRTRDARFDGRLFTAVRTTGIYCRPICPARTPKPESVIFYPSAAAAQEAGFRPCLRCRPETSPDLAAWQGTSNTVTRALGMIERGAMDAANVETLADRLGVGARQLRRLFRQHLGASPVAVAQTRRVLLAKQLIHETTLPMAEVAMAAGFGSVRRFNETFQSLFDRPPAALRRGRTALEGLGEREGITLKLAYRPPYDWAGIISFLTARAIPGVESVAPQRYARVIASGETAGTLIVKPGKGNWVTATIRTSDLRQLPGAVARVRRLFDLAADPVAIGRNLAEDPALAARVAARPGLRVPGAWDGFELAIRAILGQQITVSAATALAGKLVAAYGTPLGINTAEAGLTHVFPRPERIASTDPATLSGVLGMPRARGAAICSLAGALMADPGMFGPARGLDDAVARLRSLPGIGEWTAQYIAMRELREPDAFPASDIGLLRALAGPDGTRPTPAELLRRAERWRPWRAYAALHLWQSVWQSGPATSNQEERLNDRDAA
jgi:AraC family transcriptional regulator of adaptative response / DNA-3-methyladenine glycosylase II